ncbi:MAG: TRAP transporter small permease [Desulfobulbaceae bacterium]|nr:TRAP transporter small permease [Desulfobulbaceae bacterium]
MLRNIVYKIHLVFEIFSEKLDRAVLLSIVILSVPLVIIILYAVFMRYVINAAPTWSEEIARYLMVWMSLLATSAAMRRGQHIGLTFVVEKAGPRLRKVLNLLAYALVLLFFSVLMVKGIDMTFFVSQQRSPSVNIPMWIPYLSVPVAGFLMLIQTLTLIFKQFESPERKN